MRIEKRETTDILTINEDIRVGDVILEAGDKIRVLESVELTDTPSRREVSQNWPGGVLYRGQPIFDEYMRIVRFFIKNFNIEGQEVYLGYSPSKDKFYSGYDSRIIEGSENRSYHYLIGFEWEHPGNAMILKEDYTLFYPAGYNWIQKNIRDIIDIRLD